MAERPEYTEIEHTADVGLALRAPDLGSAFSRTAAAAFDLMCDLTTVGASLDYDVRAEGRPGDIEHLMIRWLAELLYVATSEGVLLSQFEIVELEPGAALDASRIVARARGERYDPSRHRLKVELKAPTYHELRVERVRGAWSVRVIFDT